MHNKVTTFTNKTLNTVLNTNVIHNYVTVLEFHDFIYSRHHMHEHTSSAQPAHTRLKLWIQTTYKDAQICCWFL